MYRGLSKCSLYSFKSGENESCDWLIEVESGYAIEITGTSFQVNNNYRLCILKSNSISKQMP